jgi:pimeloyl-ACP methyl ester carboxylesterase
MKYEYNARVSVIEAPERNGSSIGKGQVSHNFSTTETIKAVERNSCDRGKTWKEMTGNSISQTQTTGNQQVDARVNVGVNADGTYSVSVGLPQIQGETTGSQSSQYSGQCTTKEGKSFTMPPTATTIDGNSLTSDGSHRIDPSDPNRLSGSFTHTWQNVTETITWSLQKCGADLRLIDLKFEDMKFPVWNEWQEITEQKGTIDGNLVKIKAKILNASGETKFADVKLKETFKGDKWNGAMSDGLLDGGEISVRLDAGEEREVELVWDSSGYSWFDDGRPRLVQRIKAELEEKGKKVDEITKNLKVAPKPLVLVHGLWSSWKAWEPWQNILTTSHSYDWKAFPVGEKADKGIMNTGGAFLSTDPTKSIAENARELEKYIKYAREDRNAWHVDIVAHSMGGLISRYYISQIMDPQVQDGKPPVTKLVMLGTPNMGSPCADVMQFAFEMVGKNVEAVRQLQQDYVAGFNRINTARKGVKFSVLAGDPLPTMCNSIVWNDGVVPVPSAIWEIADNAKSKSLHTDLTGTSDFSNFVKPRVAIGPKGDHMPDVQIPTRAEFSPIISEPRNYGKSALIDALTANALQGDMPWAKAAAVPGGQTVEIELPVRQAQNFGITFMAPADVSVTLVDDKGNAAGKNLSDSPESRGWFRSIFVDKPVTAGTWKLRLQNRSERELEAVLTSWANAAK